MRGGIVRRGRSFGIGGRAVSDVSGAMLGVGNA